MTTLDRPARRDDLAAVLRLWLAFDTEVRGFPDSDESDVLQDWDAPGFDLDRQTRVLEDDGELVAYAVVNGPECDVTVLPSRAGAGLEERLLEWAEGAAEPGTTLEHFVPTVLPSMEEVFRTRGWHPARTFWRMRVDHASVPPAPDLPPGVTVRDFDLARDARPAYELVQTAFADIGGQHRRTWEEWSTAQLDPARFDPSLYLVAESGDGMVGVAVTQDLADYGFVRQLAVPSDARGRGIGRALLRESFRRHALRGLPQTQLGVDAANRTGASRLYESVGMRVTEEFTRFEKQVG